MTVKLLPPALILLFFLLLQAGCTEVPWLPGNETLPTRVPTISLPRQEQPPVSSSRPEPEATLPVQAEPQVVWLASPAGQAVLRIDPSSNRVAASIPVAGEPDSVAADGQSVWALDRKHGLVFRIDPKTNRVAASISLPPGSADALALGAGFAWVGMTGIIDLSSQMPGQEGDVQPDGKVVQIDLKTNVITAELPVQPVSRVAVDGSALWVLSRSTIDTPLQVFDLNTRQGMAVPLRNGPDWLPAEAIAVGPDSLWLFSAAYAKIFHATPDGRILAAVPFIEKKPTGYTDLLLTGAGLWAATPWGSILHIDRTTNHLNAQIDLDIPLSSLSAADGSVWAHSQQRGILFRIDPDQNRVIAEIQTGDPLQPTVVPTPTSRIVIWKPCPDGPTSRLKVGTIAYVTKDPPLPNRIRKEPTREAEIIGRIGPGGGMDILEGPACADGWVWWKVKNADFEGWTAEGDQETYWLIPLYQ